MNVVYLLGDVGLAAIIFSGLWMMVSGRPLIRLGRQPRTPAAERWGGAGQIVGGAAVITEFSLVMTNSTSNVGADIGGLGVGAMFLCYGASWWVDHRASRPVSN